MATLYQARQRAEKIKNLNKILFDYIRKIEGNFLTLEKERLHDRSQDIFGRPLGYYSLATALITDGKKQAGDPFTAVDTGDFFKGMYMKVVGDKIYFGSTDPKTDDILKSEHWLSHELFGLSDYDLKYIIDNNLRPYLQITQRKILGI